MILISGVELASGRTQSHTPWTTVIKDVRTFISAEYLPPDIILKDPRDMKGEHISQSLNFWREREQVHGASEAFRWAAYLNDKKDIVPAEYERRRDLEKAANEADRRKVNRARARALRFSNTSGPEPYDASNNEPIQMSQSPPGHTTQRPNTISLDTATPDDGPGTPVMLSRPLDCDIDPSLLTDQDINSHPTQSPEGSHPAGPPVPEHTIIDGITLTMGYTIASMEVMARLQSIGVPTPEPVNGPQEGLPHYIVRLEDVARLSRVIDPLLAGPSTTQGHAQEYGSEDRGSRQPSEGHSLSPRPHNTRKKQTSKPRDESPKKKRKTNAQSLTIAEAVKFTGDITLNSRQRGGQRNPGSGVQTRANGRATRHSR